MAVMGEVAWRMAVEEQQGIRIVTPRAFLQRLAP
jgi:hypothetical protein